MFNKKNLNLSDFKLFLNGRKPSEILYNKVNFFKKVGLNENEINRLINITNKYEKQLNEKKEINLNWKSDAILVYIAYFTLLENNDFERISSEKIKISLKHFENNEDLRKVNDYLFKLNGGNELCKIYNLKGHSFDKQIELINFFFSTGMTCEDLENHKIKIYLENLNKKEEIKVSYKSPIVEIGALPIYLYYELLTIVGGSVKFYDFEKYNTNEGVGIKFNKKKN